MKTRCPPLQFIWYKVKTLYLNRTASARAKFVQFVYYRTKIASLGSGTLWRNYGAKGKRFVNFKKLSSLNSFVKLIQYWKFLKLSPIWVTTVSYGFLRSFLKFLMFTSSFLLPREHFTTATFNNERQLKKVKIWYGFPWVKVKFSKLIFASTEVRSLKSFMKNMCRRQYKLAFCKTIDLLKLQSKLLHSSFIRNYMKLERGY